MNPIIRTLTNDLPFYTGFRTLDETTPRVTSPFLRGGEGVRPTRAPSSSMGSTRGRRTSVGMGNVGKDTRPCGTTVGEPSEDEYTLGTESH